MLHMVHIGCVIFWASIDLYQIILGNGGPMWRKQWRLTRQYLLLVDFEGAIVALMMFYSQYPLLVSWQLHAIITTLLHSSGLKFMVTKRWFSQFIHCPNRK